MKRRNYFNELVNARRMGLERTRCGGHMREQRGDAKPHS